MHQNTAEETAEIMRKGGEGAPPFCMGFILCYTHSAA